MRTASPEWAQWPERGEDEAYTLGVEEEVMLVHPGSWALAQAVERVLRRLPDDLRGQVCSETHSSAVELNTGVHRTVGEAVTELGALRRSLRDVLGEMGLTAASAGTHPFAFWHDMRVSEANRHQVVYGSMRELARREPTFALHVHVGIGDPDIAVRTADRMRAHVPLLLALSANSPFWQGIDTGYASYRTMLWQRWPTAGMPGLLASAAEYRAVVQSLIRSGVIADAGQIYWNVRLNQTHHTLEIRVADACTTIDEAVAYSGLSRALVRVCVDEGRDERRFHAVRPEMLAAARWRAARSGLDDVLIDPVSAEPLPAPVMVDRLMSYVRPALEDVGDWDEVSHLVERTMARGTSAARQRATYRRTGRLEDVVDVLAGETALA